CSSGSPPVNTTKRPSAPRPQVSAMAPASSAGVRKRAPPGPSVPTKSVSQNEQVALPRSLSRPFHRLQPANRQKTAARPVWPPSPCRVLNISLTAYFNALSVGGCDAFAPLALGGLAAEGAGARARPRPAISPQPRPGQWLAPREGR